MTESQLETAVQDIWNSMLGLEISHTENKVVPAENTVTSLVSLTGTGTWVVEVRCGWSMAQQVTAAMFGMDPGEPELADIIDAMGEIANMCSGAVKPIVDITAKTGMPSVAIGSAYQMTTPEVVVVTHVCMESGDEPLEVRVLASKAIAA